MADACVHIMQNVDFNATYGSDQKEIRNTYLNIVSGEDISIKNLSEMIKDIIGFNGALVFNFDKPDGAMQKLTNVNRLNGLGWKSSVVLKDGVKLVYYQYYKVKFNV